MSDAKMLTVSPFRLGEQPNIRLGVAMITSAPEAISLHEKVVNEMWRGAIKGTAAALHVRNLLTIDGKNIVPATTVTRVDQSQTSNAQNVKKANKPGLRENLIGLDSLNLLTNTNKSACRLCARSDDGTTAVSSRRCVKSLLSATFVAGSRL
jgi:hypothetical protein